MTARQALVVEDLVTVFDTPEGEIRPVDGVSFTIPKGGIVCLVGESGSGKSVTALSLMRLIDPPGRIAAGRIQLGGIDLLTLTESEMNHIRGRNLAMIFQEPLTALNPSRRVGGQIAEVLRIHRSVSRRQAMRHAVDLLEKVGIPDPAVRARAYPHQLSGGMRQRVMIAIACACDPDLILADEPTTALDVTVQAQVLRLLVDMQERTGSALLFITHDLGVVAEIADRVVVLYAGQVVEEAEAARLFDSPAHPYTEALIASVPDVDAPRSPKRRLASIDGTVPLLTESGPGCRFRDRCPKAHARCQADPPLVEPEAGRKVRCWLHVS